MIKRLFIALVFIVSFLWIGFVGYGIFTSGNEFSEAHLFNSSDSQLLIINGIEEVDIDLITDFANTPILPVIKSIDQSFIQSAFCSFQRPHALFILDTLCTEETIRSFFKSSNLSFTGNEFNLGDFKGKYKRDRIYISTSSFPLSNQPLSLNYDKKASANIITVSDNQQQQVIDLYYTQSNRLEFISTDSKLKQGRKISDEALFSSVITHQFSTYHFAERDYLLQIDSVFEQNIMSTWVMNGIVELTYHGAPAIITDYIDGQDPILILNDEIGSLDSNQFNLPLNTTFNGDQSYFVKYLEDLVVIAHKEETCDQLIADFKLGNTIALSSPTQKMLFGSLPKNVSERMVTKTFARSASMYNGYMMETRSGIAASNESTPSLKKQRLVLPCNFDIRSFNVLEGNGNIIVLGTNGEIVRFTNGKEVWREQIDSPPMGDLQLIDLNATGERFILVNTEDNIHLFNLNGTPVNGFPIQIDESLMNETRFYRWKGNSYFLSAMDQNKLIQHDSHGRELHLFNTELTTKKQASVWASQGKLFVGIQSKNQFEMYHVDKQKSHRVFDLPTDALPMKVPNELLHFSCINGKLTQIDQKGLHTTIGDQYARGTIESISRLSKNQVITLKNGNEIHLLNQHGIPFSSIRIPFNEIEDIAVFSTNTGETTLAVIDGLENNVYLYRSNGDQLVKTPIEGSKQVILNRDSDNDWQITTIVDQFVVQYIEN